MASSSSLLRLTTSVVQFRPAVAKAVSVVPFRHSRLIVRSFSSPSKNPLPKFTFDLHFLRSQIKPGVPSILFTMVNDEEMTVTIPGMKKTENEEGVWLSFDVPKLGKRELTMDFEGFNFLIQLKTPEKMYLATIKLPENYNPYGDLKGRFEDGICYICLPTQKTPDPILAKANINRDFTRPTPYCDMFNRSDLGWTLCEITAHPKVKSKSFTVYKKDTVDSIYMKGNLPGVEKMVVTREGLCVSLSMPGFELEDVEAGFEYDTLIVEGKREGEHYIAGVRVPEGFCKENDMIKREMQDGAFKATLPRADENRLVFSVYR
ncbi:putative HSP20-like chaperone [Helianthus annuus]|nr:putative HSP20-like chaperone [Helianthus annuus]